MNIDSDMNRNINKNLNRNVNLNTKRFRQNPLPILLLALALALVFTLAVPAVLLSGCAPTRPSIAFFIYDGDDTYITQMMDSIQKQISPTYDISIYDAKNSQSVQNRQISEALDGNANLLIINAVDRLACRSIVEKCRLKGVQIIFFNREPTADAMAGDRVYYVGAAADSLGKKQADMVAKLFGTFPGSVYDKNSDGVIQLAILKGEQGHQDAEKRTEHCVSRLRELGYEVDVLALEVADWVRKAAQESMMQIYTTYNDSIELVFANNDDMALGAIDYLTEAGIFRINSGGYRQPFVLVGVDGTRVGLEAVKEKLLYGTVLNDSIHQADAILSLVDYILNKKDMSSFGYRLTNGQYVYIDGEIITMNEVDRYLVER